MKALGKEVAKLSTKKQLTELEQLVKHEFNEKIESYKKDLNKELAMTMEPIKAALAKNNITHQIEYEFLHRKRAEVIVVLYGKLQELHSAMMNWTAPIKIVVENAKTEELERMGRANKAIVDFKNYYLRNKIFLPEELCDSIDKLFAEYWDKGWEFGYSKSRLESGQLNDEYFKHYSENLTKISKELRDNLPDRIQEIESRIRKMLRVEDEREAVEVN